MRIAITADHNGIALKALLVAHLADHELADRCPHTGETVDYPALCADVCRQVTTGRADRAIVIGGSGMGESIACNKINGIRAGLCHDLFTTGISRAHNNANVLILGAKVISDDLAAEIVDAWLTTPFKGGPHQRRLDQIAALERGENMDEVVGIPSPTETVPGCPPSGSSTPRPSSCA
jgi:ribose 5-phosphate isomerase B